MKFQYKALVAALALSASAVPAQAAFTLSGPSSNGDSSFFLTVVDNTNNVSALFDLGFSNSQFTSLVSQAATSGGSFSWDLTKGDYSAAWTSFWDIAQNNTNLQWGVMSADNAGGGAGSRNLITTYSSGSKMVGSQFTNTLTNFDEYLKANENLGNHASVANGASTAISGAAFAENAKAYGTSGRINQQGYDTTTVLGGTMTIRQLVNGAANTTPLTETTLQNANGNYTFSLSSSGVLTFATPVPEADSYAMLLAGLGVIGLVARRRKA